MSTNLLSGDFFVWALILSLLIHNDPPYVACPFYAFVTYVSSQQRLRVGMEQGQKARLLREILGFWLEGSGGSLQFLPGQSILPFDLGNGRKGDERLL